MRQGDWICEIKVRPLPRFDAVRWRMISSETADFEPIFGNHLCEAWPGRSVTRGSTIVSMRETQASLPGSHLIRQPHLNSAFSEIYGSEIPK
jgi:hypothetical protein